MILKEFSIINRFFKRKKNKSNIDLKIDIGDDCALINFNSKQSIVISTDTMVCGNHFLPDINPSDLAYKALTVNISDIAAMGGKPVWLMLSLTIPRIDELWLKIFSDSLFKWIDFHQMQLIGGDTTSGPLSVTISVIGLIKEENALKRSGAQPGDLIYVTGSLGKSAAGLSILKNKLVVENDEDRLFLVKSHLRPESRILHGQMLQKIANSAIDISDGLISDMFHILHASNVGALINLDYLPISSIVLKYVKKKQALIWALSGGEDYELLFTIPQCNVNTINMIFKNKLNTSITCIGRITKKIKDLIFLQNGKVINIDLKGYDHFK